MHLAVFIYHYYILKDDKPIKGSNFQCYSFGYRRTLYNFKLVLIL